MRRDRGRSSAMWKFLECLGRLGVGMILLSCGAACGSSSSNALPSDGSAGSTATPDDSSTDSPSAPSPGGEGQACYPNGTCNAGLSCLSHTCVVLPGSDAALDQSSGGDANAVIDSAVDAAGP